MASAFFDTNILIYLIGADAAKADRADELIAGGGVVSVQVLNEFASVASGKQRMAWPEIVDTLSVIRSLCRVEPLTVDVHEHALRLVQGGRAFSLYDAMIVASALAAGCDTLYSEDFQHRRQVENALTILNPFRA